MKIILLLLSLFFVSYLNAQTGYSSLNSFEELEIQISELKSQLDNDLHSGKVYELIELLYKRGDFEEIEYYCKKLINNKPADLKPRLLMAENYLETFMFFEAEKLIKEILNEQPNTEAKLLLVKLHMAGRDYISAASLAEEIFKADHRCLEAVSAIASVKSLEGNIDSSRLLYNYMLVIDPGSPAANLGLSHFYYSKGNIDFSKKFCRKAIESNYFNSKAHELLGYIYFKEGKIDSAESELMVALKCNNYNLEAHRDLGRGITNHDYSSYPDMEQLKGENFALWELLDLGDKASREKNSAKEFLYYNEALKLDSSNIFVLLRLGNYYWTAGDYLKSKEAFNTILKKYPGYGLAHNGYYVSLSSIVDYYVRNRNTGYILNKINVIADEKNISIDDTASLYDIFINLKEFPDKIQKGAIISAAPFGHLLRTLKESGATFEILPLYEKLTDSPKRKYLEGTRIPDKRLWDDVGGNGGINATTGVSSLWDAVMFKYNELAHEFAHQIHQYTLSDTQKAELEKLYENALLTNKYLDDYAKTNVLEYFAVGYEAFISKYKRADQTGYHGHTRDELMRKDEELFKFFQKIIDKYYQ